MREQAGLSLKDVTLTAIRPAQDNDTSWFRDDRGDVVAVLYTADVALPALISNAPTRKGERVDWNDADLLTNISPQRMVGVYEEAAQSEFDPVVDMLRACGVTVEDSFIRRTVEHYMDCLLYTSPSPRDVEESRMPSSA